jgi:hypothetical protein
MQDNDFRTACLGKLSGHFNRRLPLGAKADPNQDALNRRRLVTHHHDGTRAVMGKPRRNRTQQHTGNSVPPA